MCTLSIFQNDDDLIITMNRDEQRNRPEENKLFTTDKFCFPIDKKSQGTWVGVNHHGIAFAILNRYQDAHKDNNVQSRGSLIPSLLSCTNLNDVIQNLQNLSINMFNPFDCLAISRGNITKATWDGENLHISQESITAPFFLSSSSERLKDVLRQRQTIFDGFSNQYKAHKNSTDHILENLHLSRGTDNDQSSILMRRSQTHTKSITQITLSKNEANMAYWPEDVLQSVLNSGSIIDYNIGQSFAFNII